MVRIIIFTCFNERGFYPACVSGKNRIGKIIVEAMVMKANKLLLHPNCCN